MSMLSEIGLAPENPEPPSTPLRFLVGQDREGHWIVKESHGLAGGIFVSREAAVDYAEFEAGHRPGSVHLATQVLELGL